MIDYSSLPEHMQPGIRRYIEDGVRPGHFLTALLSNQLVQAFRRADDTNQAAMLSWVRFLYSQAPAGCSGSPSHFESWINEGGINSHAAYTLEDE